VVIVDRSVLCRVFIICESKRDEIHQRQNRPPLRGRDLYVVSVIGEDQVGIVSEVTRLLGSGFEKERSGIVEYWVKRNAYLLFQNSNIPDEKCSIKRL